MTGKRSCYTRGCDHDDCREANRLYQLAWRKRHLTTHRLVHGRWIKRVAPVAPKKTVSPAKT